MLESLHFEGIAQYDKLNVRDRLRQTREAATESIQTVAATLPQSTLCTSQPRVELDYKSLQTKLPICRDSLDYQDCSHIHKPLNQARKGLCCKLIVFPLHFVS